MNKISHGSHWGAFNAIVENGRLVRVEPTARDTNPSPILRGMPDAIYHGSRVARPAIRKSWLAKGYEAGGQGRGAEPFVEVPWDEALDLVASELKRVKAAYGNEAIFAGSYGWSSAGRFHHAKTQLQRFMGGFGGFTSQKHSYSLAAGLAILPHILGDHQTLRNPSSWAGIEQNTKLFLAFGGCGTKNAQVEPGGSGEHTAGPWMDRLANAGVDFISITPVRDDTPPLPNVSWLPIRPNTDVAMMLALAHTIVSEGLHAKDFLAEYTVGFARFERYLLGADDGAPKSAEWAADITGIDAEYTRALARRMVATRTMIATSYSLQRGDHGEQTFWMTAVLGAIVGQIGLPGGGFGFGYGSMHGQGNPVTVYTAPALSAGPNPTGSFIPVARISDLLLNPGKSYQFDGEDRVYPDTRMIYWCGGNPFHHHQDLNRLIAAWQRPETIIVNEPWWTATARYADIVLPATTTLERNDIGASSRDRFIIAMKKAVDPVGDARNDYDIFRTLARGLGFEKTFTEGREEMDWLRHMYEVSRQDASRVGVELPNFDGFWAQGYAESPIPKTAHTVLSKFRSDPAANPLKTPSGKIEIFCDEIAGFGYDDCPGHPVWMEPIEWLGSKKAATFPLHLISNQPAGKLHSQMDFAGESAGLKINGREPVLLNPDDAASRGIRDNDVVRVFNDRGATLAAAVITDGVRPGVVRLSTGAWYDPREPGRIGTLDKHGNPNMLTPDKGTSKLGQGPIAHTALVEVERYDGDPGEVTAFDPPKLERRA